jgi:hypothetical protein
MGHTRRTVRLSGVAQFAAQCRKYISTVAGVVPGGYPAFSCRAANTPYSRRWLTRSGCVAANMAAVEPPSEMPASTARSTPTVSMTAARSSTR